MKRGASLPLASHSAKMVFTYHEGWTQFDHFGVTLVPFHREKSVFIGNQFVNISEISFYNFGQRLNRSRELTESNQFLDNLINVPLDIYAAVGASWKGRGIWCRVRKWVPRHIGQFAFGKPRLVEGWGGKFGIKIGLIPVLGIISTSFFIRRRRARRSGIVGWLSFSPSVVSEIKYLSKCFAQAIQI